MMDPHLVAHLAEAAGLALLAVMILLLARPR